MEPLQVKITVMEQHPLRAREGDVSFGWVLSGSIGSWSAHRSYDLVTYHGASPVAFERKPQDDSR